MCTVLNGWVLVLDLSLSCCCALSPQAAMLLLNSPRHQAQAPYVAHVGHACVIAHIRAYEPATHGMGSRRPHIRKAMHRLVEGCAHDTSLIVGYQNQA